MFAITKKDIEDKRISFSYYEPEYSGVIKVAGYVANDLEKVFGTKPQVVKINNEGKENTNPEKKQIVFATLNQGIQKSDLPENVDVSAIENKRECYQYVVEQKGDCECLYIIGSDKRGTVYGLFHLSSLAGVSPFVDWLDATPAKKDIVTIADSELKASKEPSVRYRGFFINDEWPAFGNWSEKHFGGFNAKVYEEVFKLLLRMKGNYLWPAMWSARFSVDGPDLASAILADELGVVMGMSHHEPCLRHGEEYKYLRGKDSIYGDAWDFQRNREGITRFWKDGLLRSGRFENVITVGMRGEADSTILGREATLKDNIDLLRGVLETQNQLIKECVNENLDEVPRMLALYKEVEPFYYGDATTEGLKGSKELEGVTLMLCDDNFGNLRTLPTEDARDHKGGYGMYYHFDYHGGPISYEWVNSSSLHKTWEQMTTAFEFGIRELWIVNVGDLFGNEFPLSYFLSLAYDYERWGIDHPDSPQNYTKQFVEKQFGAHVTKEQETEIFELIEGYTKIAHNRHAEAMNADVYAPFAFGERETLYASCTDLMKRAEALREQLGKGDADEADNLAAFLYYELVYYPLMANLNVQKMWLDTTYNHYLASIGVPMANQIGEKIEACIETDKNLVEELHTIHDGKWYGMGLSEHIGFKNWNEEECSYPVIHTVRPANKNRVVAVIPETGVHTEGSVWTRRRLVIDSFALYQSEETSIYLYANSDKEAAFEVSVEGEWCDVSPKKGIVKGSDMEILQVRRTKEVTDCVKDCLIKIHADFMDAEIVVSACKQFVQIDEKALRKNTFYMAKNYIAMEAANFSAAKDAQTGAFKKLENFGRTEAGMKAFPVTNRYAVGEGPVLEYDFVCKEKGTYNVQFYLAPSNPTTQDKQTRFGVSCNDSEIQVENMIPTDFAVTDDNLSWSMAALSNIRTATSQICCKEGLNTLRISAIDPGFVMEKIVIFKAGTKLQDSYLGAKETVRLN